MLAKNLELENLIQEVNRTQQQLIHSEKMAGLGQLVAGIAHELNNPIGFIYANLFQIRKYLDLLEKSPMDEKTKPLISKIDQALRESQEGSVRIRDIVQNLRGLSRNGGTAQAHILHKKPCDIAAILDKSLQLAQTNFSKSIQIEKDYQSLPLVQADETQIQQVFLNILINAGQALGDSGKIFLKIYSEDARLVITIRDNGPGITSENLARIFDPFFTTKPVGQGIGLGLHICYEILQAHEGNLSVTSEFGQGATFKIILPQKEN